MDAPAGPVLRLGGGEVDGEEWEVVVYRSGDGDLCTHQRQGSGGGGGCGERVAEGATFGPIGTSPTMGGSVIVSALLSGEARRVRIEGSGGELVEVDTLPLDAIGFALSGFATALPPDHQPSALVALDAGGRELDRFELLPIAPIPGGPGPTPESP
jgi:hypothetical protein